VTNPFDYANPVTDPTLFAGRARELAEVEYYLELALSNRSAGLAFIGPRTSGKTSILNVAQARARQRKFLVARLDLTSADVLSEDAFLILLYEALFIAAKEADAWHPHTRKVYAAFRDAMTGNSPTALREYCDLAFPQAVATAVVAGRPVGGLPSGLVVRDLKELQQSFLEGSVSGIALLIDEGDKLAELPVALEKLRFVMSASAGLAVIVAGTERMLESMDKVFAPIVRQFRRVSLRPFISPAETRQCLLQRLKKADADGVLTQPTYQQLHDLAQGEPYVAQLVGHSAFKRFAERPEEGFGLTVSILNDVLAQVEGFRDSGHGRFAATIRRYDRDELTRLAHLAVFPRLSLYDRAKLDVVVGAAGRVKQRIAERQRELKGWMERFRDDGVLRATPGISGAWELNGDQFDKLYVKLVANTKGIPWRIDERPLVELSESRAALVLRMATNARQFPSLVLEEEVASLEDTDASESDLAFVETRYEEVMSDLMRHLRSWRLRELIGDVVDDLAAGREPGQSVWAPTLVAEAGRGAVRACVGQKMATARIVLRNEHEERIREMWLQPADVYVSAEDWRTKVLDAIEKNSPGMEALGWTASLVSCEIERAAILDQVLRVIIERRWDAVRDDVMDEIQNVTLQAYYNDAKDRAKEVAGLGVKYAAEADRWRHQSDLGYMLMAEGRFEDAEAILRESCRGAKNVVDLPHYNLAVCLGMRGDREAAEALFRDVEARIGGERFADERVDVLLVLRSEEGGLLDFAEEREIRLIEAIQRCLHAL
jgi:hypothetical protein